MIPTKLRKKKVWDVEDFREFLGGDEAGVSHWQARERLKTYDTQLGGKLLLRTQGTNRGYKFYPAALAKAFPELFESLEGVMVRLEDHEERLGDLFHQVRTLTSATAQNTRDIAKIRAAPSATSLRSVGGRR